ncbi:MAG: transposase [Selenomonadaceae bacterium]|nr:transposase [Selenomonadaceae bacterium]
MLKSYRTEILPTPRQCEKIRRSIGICRWLYNEYIARNKRLYRLYQRGCLDERQKHFLSAMDFDKFVNHHLKNTEELSWINECGSKARKKAITNAEMAFRKFFHGEAGFPKFKKRGRQSVGIYFPKNNKGDWTIERHRIQIPTIGKVRLKEFGYLPAGATAKSGVVSQKADRYYVSVVIDIPSPQYAPSEGEPLGIDLGLKDFAILSDGTKFKNINKTAAVRRLEKKLRREQRRLSRKLEHKKKKGSDKPAAFFANISKNVLKVQKLHHRLASIRTNYTNQVIHAILKREPSFIAIEDLNVSGMMKNRHLAKAVTACKFYEFRTKLTAKCHERGIELRVVDRFYPSSKTCHACGHVKKDLKLSDRTYTCTCGYTADRDHNAALNLRDAKTYEIA